jgi:hypothetical protein
LVSVDVGDADGLADDIEDVARQVESSSHPLPVDNTCQGSDEDFADMQRDTIADDARSDSGLIDSFGDVPHEFCDALRY